MTPTAQALEEVLALAELATPGEWAWVERSGYLSIAAPHGGGTTVMDFCRRGTQGAQPRFGVSLDGEPRGRRGGVLLTAVELMARNPDGRLSHPDAELIIAAANFIRTHGPALLAQLGGGREVADGWVRVPKMIYVGADSWEAAQFAIGGPGNGEGEAFMDCTLWIGEIEADDGTTTHGLHVSCDECPEEGSITLAEFPATPTEPAQAGRDGGCA